MDYVVCTTIFILVTFILVLITFKIVLIKIEEFKDFKENSYKTQAKIVSYDSRYDIDSNVEYCPIYSFQSPEGKPILLSSDMYSSEQVCIGATAEIYYNPNRPTKCYSGKFDILVPIIIMVLASIVFTCSSIILVMGII